MAPNRRSPNGIIDLGYDALWRIKRTVIRRCRTTNLGYDTLVIYEIAHNKLGLHTEGPASREVPESAIAEQRPEPNPEYAIISNEMTQPL